ncbi:glycerate kinase [Nitratireductor mangrovi]|uniref:Glycerate kinase n=1 Tax=Nitratireductor mangrovi TaxID=2599600 RepID=A0A5B8KXT7_9HYPH|nr:glycerate kinase [Nitratireductor mangrovi]QDZ00392.1 glycerate kinase [Nitratireductor mangrovi]
MQEAQALYLLKRMFGAAVAAADPMRVVADRLTERASGRTVVVGAGKASARMAEAVEDAWGPCSGLVITRDGYERPLRGITLRSASHPVPDQRGHEATCEMLNILDSLGEGDLALVLISGGGSALLVQPAGNITLAEKQQVNEALLSSGAPIGEMNVVRRHLSAVKGGRLAARAYPARCHTLAISDVAGDDPVSIASGPTVGDVTTAADALRILARWKIDPPDNVLRHLRSDPSSLNPGSPELSRTSFEIIAAPSQSLEAASELARAEGARIVNLGDAIEGEAREVAKWHAAKMRAIANEAADSGRPLVIISGGECSVTRTGKGVGGPNAEFALALAIEFDGRAGIYALSGDTDGVDGGDEIAASIITPSTLQRARDIGIDPAASLADNDAHTFFARLGDQVITGPTLTNVNDFRAIIVT